METERPFELEALQRDWIVGMRGSDFAERVHFWLDEFSRVRRGPVLLALKERVEFSAVFMSAVYLGRPVVLCNPAWGEVEWEAVRLQLKPVLVVGEAPLVAEEVPSELKAGAILIPTGGSSGGVRFACHDWRSLTVAAEGWKVFAGSGVSGTFCLLPLFHVSGLMQLVRSFISNTTIDFGALDGLAKLSPEKQMGTVVSLVATQLERLLSDAAAVDSLRGLRAIFMGGGPMRAATAERARAAKLPLVLSYGMTETAAMVSALGTEDFLSGVFHAGCSLNHATIRIINPAGEECPSGTTGRIQVVSRALFSGYHGVETDGLKHHCYLTDDEGYLDKEGQLHVLGRVDRLIQSGGEKVDPGEVEAAMLNVSGVEAALVIGQADTEWVQRVVAFYVGGADVAVLSHLSGQLTAYKIPKLCLRVDALPLNESGKLDRAKVAALLADA